VNKESLTPTRLKECELLVIASPQSQFTDEELCVLKDYVDGGGSLAVFSAEGERKHHSNELTRMFGKHRQNNASACGVLQLLASKAFLDSEWNCSARDWF